MIETRRGEPEGPGSVKPLSGEGETFSNTPALSGGATLGEGRVGLILDMEGLYKDRCDD